MPIILTTAKFERLQPKTVKLHQSSLVQSIDWCQQWGHYMSRQRKCTLSRVLAVNTAGRAHNTPNWTATFIRLDLSSESAAHPTCGLSRIWFSPERTAWLKVAWHKEVTCLAFEHDKTHIPPAPPVHVPVCSCISTYDETLRKELEAAPVQAEHCLHNAFWILEGPARPRCQPASRYRASSNGTDNGEADTCRQHVCRAGTKEGR